MIFKVQLNMLPPLSFVFSSSGAKNMFSTIVLDY